MGIKIMENNVHLLREWLNELNGLIEEREGGTPIVARDYGPKLPSEYDCPMCGSKEVTRLYCKKGDEVHFGLNKWVDADGEWIEKSGYSPLAAKDLIKHHCTCCQHNFFSEPLNVLRKQWNEHGSSLAKLLQEDWSVIEEEDLNPHT